MCVCHCECTEQTFASLLVMTSTIAPMRRSQALGFNHHHIRFIDMARFNPIRMGGRPPDLNSKRRKRVVKCEMWRWWLQTALTYSVSRTLLGVVFVFSPFLARSDG